MPEPLPPPPSAAPAPDLARLFAELPLGVLHFTQETVDYANRAIAGILRLEPEELVGRSMADLVMPSHLELVQKRYWARQRGEPVPGAYELEARRSDGTIARLEVEPRVTGPRQLLVLAREVGDRVRDTALLAVLAESALLVQRARTEEEALSAAAAALRALGINFIVARRCGSELVFEHAAIVGPERSELEGLLGRPLQGLVVPASRQHVLGELGYERRVVFLESALPFFTGMLRHLRRDLAPAELERRMAAAGYGRAALCPLTVEGEIRGFLGIAANDLTSADASAMGLFAAQVSSALESIGAIGRLEARNRELAALQQVAAAGSEASLSGLLPRLLRIATASLASDDAAIYLIDEKVTALELAEATELARPLVERLRTFPLDFAAVRQTFVQLKAVAISVAEHVPPEFRSLLQEAGYRHIAVVPLHIRGHLAGCLVLGRVSARPFAADELRTAEFLGDQMAIQIENARLYADASRRLRLVSTLFDLSRLSADALPVRPLVERVISQAMSALAVDGATVHILEGGRLVLAGQQGGSPGQAQALRELPCDATSLSGRAVVERRVLAMGEEDWRKDAVLSARAGAARFVAAAPLVFKDRAMGTLLVARSGAREFTDEELRLLEAFASQAASALEQARSLEEERRRMEDLKLFLEVGRVVTASLDLEQILEASATSLARIAEATDGFVLLLDAHRRILRGVASSSAEFRAHFRTVRIGLEDRSVVSQTVLTRLPVRVSDVSKANLLRADLVERYRQKSLAVLPLTVRDEAIGAVMLSDERAPRQWTDAQIERATVLARQVAVAVANARLYEDLKRSYEELARTQEELVKRERLAALGELAAVVAHEVRNPLGVIFNSLRSLGRAVKPEGDAAMLLGMIGEEADRLNRIVGDLLDFARPSEPALQPEPLEAVLASVKEAAAQAAAASAVQVKLETSEPLPKAALDARMLRQALLNLVLNAIQAMPKGGTVTLSARRELRGDRQVARLEVADTGPGVPPELAERIFEPFFTTKAAGTGLGLAVVKRIVEAHRGEVALESTLGAGARFSLLLPLSE